MKETTTPDPGTLPAFYTGYVSHVQHLDMTEALESSGATTYTFVRTIPEEKGNYRYAPEKWSIREVLCHVMDAERIFAYRALRFARKDKTELPGFDENKFAPLANAHSRTVRQLAEEMNRLRATTLDLFVSFSPEMLQQTGTANNGIISVVNIGYIIAGHAIHHCGILRERYLKA